jgi:hypothetical protein
MEDDLKKKEDDLKIKMEDNLKENMEDNNFFKWKRT